MQRLLVFSIVAALSCSLCRADKSWYVLPEHLTIPLQKGELPEPGTPQIRSVFLAAGDPAKSLKTLFSKPDLVRKEMRAMAGGLSLHARKKEKGVQANGRVALVWWDMKNQQFRRSIPAKNNKFNPDTDRLAAALAVLDSKAVAAGKWLDKQERGDLPLPAKWIRAKKTGASGFPDGWQRSQGIGPPLAGIIPIAAGNFTGEQLGWDAFRNALENRIAVWMTKNPKDPVIVLIVYEYDDNRNPRCPTALRYYAVAKSGKLDVQIDGGIGTTKRGMTLARDVGGVVWPND